MGFGKGSSSSAPVVTEEQKELLKAQTGFLTETALPQYQKTIGGAEERMNLAQPYVNQAAKDVFGRASGVAEGAIQTGGELVKSGQSTLGALFDPQYEQNQIQAALQTGREAARESQLGQNAMYGAAGGLGSARMALADRNLSSLNAQRQATAAAGAQAQVQANRMGAARTALESGQSLGTLGMNAGQQQISSAGAPMDLYSKYASIVYGTPQASTTPSFQGTQGATSSGKGFNVAGPKWG
jgi:hypothetical protein